MKTQKVIRIPVVCLDITMSSPGNLNVVFKHDHLPKIVAEIRSDLDSPLTANMEQFLLEDENLQDFKEFYKEATDERLKQITTIYTKTLENRLQQDWDLKMFNPTHNKKLVSHMKYFTQDKALVIFFQTGGETIIHIQELEVIKWLSRTVFFCDDYEKILQMVIGPEGFPPPNGTNH